MNRKYLFAALVISICLGALPSSAQDAKPPVAAEVSKTVVSMWQAKKLDDLDKYIRGLYQRYPNTLAVQLAQALHEYMFEGKVRAAQRRILAVTAFVNKEPAKFPALFTDVLKTYDHQIGMELETYDRRGKTDAELERTASAAKLRDAQGYVSTEELLLWSPPFASLNYCPDASMTPIP